MTATNKLTDTAMAIVNAKSPNNCPSISLRKNTGRKMATVVTVEANNAGQTWDEPCLELSWWLRPFSRILKIFSNTTIAASNTIPTANAKPASEITFNERPVISSTINVESSEMGIAVAIIKVAFFLRIKNHKTEIDNKTPTNKLLVTKLMAR